MVEVPAYLQYKLYTNNIREIKLVRKDMNDNEHERPSNFTLRHKVKKKKGTALLLMLKTEWFPVQNVISSVLGRWQMNLLGLDIFCYTKQYTYVKKNIYGEIEKKYGWNKTLNKQSYFIYNDQLILTF